MELISNYQESQPAVVLGGGSLIAELLVEMVEQISRNSDQNMPEMRSFSIEFIDHLNNPYTQMTRQFQQATIRPKKKKKTKKRKLELVSAYLERQASEYEKEHRLLKQKIDDCYMPYGRSSGLILHHRHVFIPDELLERVEQVEAYMAVLETYRDPHSRAERRKDEEDPKPPRMKDFFENQKGRRKWS